MSSFLIISKVIDLGIFFIVMPLDQMKNEKYGKSFSIAMMPCGMSTHSFDVLSHGKHKHPIICCLWQTLGIQCSVTTWEG
jgi:hypothetical protein